MDNQVRMRGQLGSDKRIRGQLGKYEMIIRQRQETELLELLTFPATEHLVARNKSLQILAFEKKKSLDKQILFGHPYF